MLMFLAVMWEGLASALSEYPRLSMEVWATRFWYAAAAYASMVFCHSHSRRVVLVSAVLTAATLPLAFALAEFIRWVATPQAGATIHDQRQIASTLNHSNDFATYLSLLIPLGLGLIAMPTALRLTRLLASLFLVPLMFFLGLTLSRSGWLAGATAIGAYFLLDLLRVRYTSGQAGLPVLLRVRYTSGQAGLPVLRAAGRLARNLVCVALLLACFRLPAVIVPRLNPTTAPDWQGARLTIGDTGVRQRLSWWRSMASMVRERPLVGWGDGMIALTFPRYASSAVSNELPFHAHNLFVQMAVEGGLVGIRALVRIWPDDAFGVGPQFGWFRSP
jgi:hypothetical protein